jgi:hypothetical protein
MGESSKGHSLFLICVSVFFDEDIFDLRQGILLKTLLIFIHETTHSKEANCGLKFYFKEK